MYFLFLSSLLLLPLPPVGATPAKPCVEADCKLPNCRCASTNIPGGLQPSQTPQIVTISFDDGLRVEDYEGFYSKFLKGRTNPNGCPILMTHFVSHNNTDFALAEDQFSKGHEIAEHASLLGTSVSELAEEMADLRVILEAWADIPTAYTVGYRTRSPSANHVAALYETKFTYDASMPTNGTMYWPFTLDYKSPLCSSPAVCPNESYPGLWLLPGIVYRQKSGIPCVEINACVFPPPKTEGEWIELLIDNFNKHYKGNRAPYEVHATPAWFFMQGNPLEAFNTFLDIIQRLPDVYIVTQSQMLAWVRSPTPLTKVKDFQPWQCPTRPPPRCSYKNEKVCYYGDDKTLRTCVQTCPPCWPNIGDPYGQCTREGHQL